MVWIEIWEQKYNRKYDYMESNLAMRYNEKFDNLVGFLKRNCKHIVKFKFDRWGVLVKIDGVIRESAHPSEDIKGVSIRANCTDKQKRRIKEIFEL